MNAVLLPDSFDLGHEFRIEAKPRTKQRPRSGKGRIYTPGETREYEALVAASYSGPMFEGPVGVHCEFYKEFTIVRIYPLDVEKPKLRGDIDNYTKAIYDGLNGVAFLDDKQVVEQYGRKCE